MRAYIDQNRIWTWLEFGYAGKENILIEGMRQHALISCAPAIGDGERANGLHLHAIIRLARMESCPSIAYPPSQMPFQHESFKAPKHPILPSRGNKTNPQRQSFQSSNLSADLTLLCFPHEMKA